MRCLSVITYWTCERKSKFTYFWSYFSQIAFLTPTKNYQHPNQLQPDRKIMEMLVVFDKEIKPVNKEHRSILDLKLLFRNYNTRVVFVCVEVPCCFEVHILVSSCKISKEIHQIRLTLSYCTILCLAVGNASSLSVSFECVLILIISRHKLEDIWIWSS